ncbi:type II toxin-antitoxin system RelE/ParE family toxin [bacterium AH-315-F18]|nr:type II toxin-antitoxin system RelE/ParE family toxin [bacterium AH-315-F18]
MIISFDDSATSDLYHGERTKRARRFPANIVRAALQKLDILEGATTLADLRSPPGNRLEALKGNRKGQHSIRVNDQWRIVFRWHTGNAHDVALIDYHKG